MKSCERFRLWLGVVFLVTIPFVLLCTGEAWARAGGGGSFGGGGGGFGGGGFSGGGGSGGSGDGGDLIALIIWLVFKHPVIGIPLIIAFIAFTVMTSKETHSHHMTRTIRRAIKHQEKRLQVEAIDKIQTKDPQFSLVDFLRRVETAFEKIQYAWSDQELAPVRPFISDGIHERFSLQIAMQQAEGIRNVMEEVKVLNTTPNAIFSNDSFDTIHVQVTASAVDYNADLTTSKPESPRRKETFVEFWSFHRRPGAKSVAGDGAIEGNCPRCGSQLDIVDRAQCGSCGAQVNSGEFDWVLAEITQEQEWRVPKDDETTPGLAEMRQRDPGFSIQHIEDRVSVMFWKLHATKFHSDRKYITSVATPRFLDDLSDNEVNSEYWKDPAVGKVELLDIEPGQQGDEDRIRVKVRWSGTLYERHDNDRKSLRRSQTIYTHIYTLIRKQGASSPEQEAFTSAGCSGCGAPVNVNSDGSCVYCGTVLNTGQYDWVLDEISPYTSSMAYQPIRKIKPADDAWSGSVNDPHADAGLSLTVLAKVMMIDGRFSDSERNALHRLGKHRQLSPEQVDQYIDAAHNDGTHIPLPQDARQAQTYLDQLLHVILADGQISRKEKSLLKNFAEQAGLSSADVRLAINRERKRSYQAAKRELRGDLSLGS